MYLASRPEGDSVRSFYFQGASCEIEAATAQCMGREGPFAAVRMASFWVPGAKQWLDGQDILAPNRERSCGGYRHVAGGPRADACAAT